jgi:hypothetical protein
VKTRRRSRGSRRRCRGAWGRRLARKESGASGRRCREPGPPRFTQAARIRPDVRALRRWRRVSARCGPRGAEEEVRDSCAMRNRAPLRLLHSAVPSRGTLGVMRICVRGSHARPHECRGSPAARLSASRASAAWTEPGRRRRRGRPAAVAGSRPNPRLERMLVQARLGWLSGHHGQARRGEARSPCVPRPMCLPSRILMTA